MRILKKAAVIAAVALFASSGAGAATKTEECFSLLKAQDYNRALLAGRQASRVNPQDGDAQFCAGTAFDKLGDFDNALRSLQQAERLYTRKEDLSIVYSALGGIARQKGDLQLALNYHSRALGLARELGKRGDEAAALNNIALIFDARGDSDKALDYLQQAVRIEPDEAKKSVKYNNIALTYSGRGEHAKAVEYLDKAIALDRRSGDYHSAAILVLNKGSVLTEMGQLHPAEATLNEGLTAIQKVGDKYWESVAYEYLGRLAFARGQQELALKQYREALRLAKLTGATGLIESLAQKVASQQKNAVTMSYGIVEIGSKGVKAAVVTSSRDEQGRPSYETGFRKSINTNIIEGVAERGEFSPEAIEATTRAVKDLIAGIKSSSPNWGTNITVAGSSALSGAFNRNELAERIKAETGLTPTFITSAQELSYAIQGAVSRDVAHKSALLDIGSGNGRIGYLISPRGSRPAGQAVIDLRAGSVTLAELANKARQPGEDYLTALNRVVETDIQPKFTAELKQYPVIRRHKYFVLVGGAAWAMSTLMHPENQTSYVTLSREDMKEYFNLLSRNPDSLLNPDLSGIADAKDKAKAQKEIGSVKTVFTLENLQAGARLMKMIAEADPFGNASIVFARNGNWAYGLAEAQALSK